MISLSRVCVPGLFCLFFAAACDVSPRSEFSPDEMGTLSLESGNVCEDNRHCKGDTYCAKNACDAERGVCEAKPDACLAVWQPVCGCDGQTYSNSCYAAMAGANVAHDGECDGGGDDGVCKSNDNCSGDQYCAKDSCEAKAGECADRPEACPDVWQPVCGCDGKTYSNSCYAAMAGANVAHDGECDDGGDDGVCKSNDNCSGGQYCAKDSCESKAGECSDRPDACPTVWQPVCGCDGQTYSNSCYAAMAGTNVAHDGECDGGGDDGVCKSNDNCSGGQYCAKDSCESKAGECADRPEACLDVWQPVCGCDGQTYSNTCYAAMAGATVAHDGECDGGADDGKGGGAEGGGGAAGWSDDGAAETGPDDQGGGMSLFW